MKSKKTGKILKKSLILFICIWLFITQMPINNVFAEETNEQPPVTETDDQEEQEPQEALEEQENNEEENQETEPEQDPILLTDNGESNETYVVRLYYYETPVSEVESFADAVDAVNNGDANKLVLLANISISESYTFNNDVIVDLNSKKIIVAQKNENITFKGSSSTITNGTIVVSELGTSATKAVLVADEYAQLHIEQDTIIKSRVAFQLNDYAEIHISDNAEINTRNLIDTIYSTSKLLIEDQALLHLVGDVSESTGFGYWRSSGSAFNGTITITGGKFTNNQYPTYEGYTVTTKLKEYYDEGIYSDIELDDETYKYQVIKGGGITFDTQGGTWTEGFEVPYYYEYENGLRLPTSENISRAGYTFNGWLLNNEPITEIAAETTGNYDVIASWTANTDTPYVIKHIYEIEPEVFPTEEGEYLIVINCTGTTDEEVTIGPSNFISKEGYSFPNKQTKKIAGDGSTVFEIYYRLGASELAIYSIDDNKGTVAIENYPHTTAAIEEGIEVTIVAAPAPGYKFVKWVDTYDDANTISENASYKFTMGNISISYTAIFEPDRDNEVWGIKVSTAYVTRPASLCYEENGYYYYQSIADAVEFARNNAVIDIVKDVVNSESAPIEKNITINLNGHKIEQLLNEELYFVSKQIFMITSSGGLTLNGEGEIVSAVDDQYGYDKRSLIYNDGGVLTLDNNISLTTTGRNVVTIRNNSGTVYINDANITSNIVAIIIHSGGAEINDGAIIKNTSSLKEKNYYYSTDYHQTLIFFEYSNDDARVNINGGELTSTTETMFDSDYSWNCHVDVKGGVLNPSDTGYISSDRGMGVDFNGGTVNSNNYLFADYGGVIYSGFFNIKNGISSKRECRSVLGGKYHVYYQDPSKINALYYGYSVTENEYYDPITEPYEYRVLSKSTINFNVGFNIHINSIQTYKTRTMEDGLMPNDPTLKGYSFAGWYFDTGYTQKFNENEFIFIDDSYTLYAKWELNPNDPVWACRLDTDNVGLDSLRKYVEDGNTYYYYMIDKSYQYESYDNFVQAFRDASDGDTIELLQDVSTIDWNYYNQFYTHSTIDGFESDNIIFDLKGYTFTAKKRYSSIFNFSNSKCENFTIKNGTIFYDSDVVTYSSFFQAWNVPVTIYSYNVKYLSNFKAPADRSYYKLFLSSQDVNMKIYGGFIGDNICLMESFYEDEETFEVVPGYDFRFTGEDFNTDFEEEQVKKVQLKGGIYVYDPDLYTAYGYVSIENKQTKIEGEEEVEYNYEIVPGYKVHFEFNDKKTNPVKVNVPSTVGKVLSNQVPTIPEWPGYEFVGWFTQKTGGEEIEDVTNVDIEADVTYYAHWSRDIFEVSFDLNGGYVEVEGGGTTTEVSPINVEYRNIYSELPAPKKDGFYFLGWYADDEYDGDAPLIDESSDVLITHDHKLYAHWATKTITVLFDCNGGLCECIASGDGDGGDDHSLFSIVVNYDSKYGAKLSGLPSPYRDGYEFVGWYTQKTGGDKIEKDTKYVDHPAEKLYAHWAKETKKIKLYYLYKFDLDYFSVESQKRMDTKEITVTYGDTYGDALLDPTIHTTFEAESTSFIGWNTSMDGNGDFITKTDVVEYDNIESLYAIYEYPNNFIKTLYFDYGCDRSELSTSEQGSSLSNSHSFFFELESGYIPEKISSDGTSLPEPERKGYEFNGWKVGGVSINDDTSLSDLFTNNNYATAVAQWTYDTQEVFLVNFYLYDKDYYSQSEHEFYDDYSFNATCGSTFGNNLINPTIHSEFDYVHFIGWNTNSNGTGKYVTKETIFNPSDFDLNFNSNFCLYAIYYNNNEENNNRLYLDYGFNSDPANPEYLDYNSTSAVKVGDSDNGGLPMPQREGYIYNGWKVDGTLIENDTYLNTIFTNGDKYKVAVAQWSYAEEIVYLHDIYKYDAQYCSDGGHSREDEYTIDVTCGSTYGVSLIDPTIHSKYESVTFIGWNTSPSGDGKYITSASVFNPSDYENSDPSSVQYTLYAIYYCPSEFYKTIYFDYGYKQDEPLQTIFTYRYYFEEESVDVPEKVIDTYSGGYIETTSLPEPERFGYEFKGWKIDGVLVDDDTLLSSIFTNGSIYKKAIAQWQVIEDGVNSTFYANGGMFGSGDDASNKEEINQTLGSTYELPTNDPTREGYEFVGWYLVEGEGSSMSEEGYSANRIREIITSSSVVKEEDCCSEIQRVETDRNEIIIYAIWEPSTIEYTINHIFINPFYEENYESYYEEKYLLKDSDTYEVDNNSIVTVYSKEYEGMANDSWNATFEVGMPIRINEKHDAYKVSEYDDSYDETKPYNIYYNSDTNKVIVDWNYDGNLKYEEEKTYEYTTYDKYYRDIFTLRQEGRDSTLYSVYNTESGQGGVTNPGYTFSKWVDDDGNPIVFYDFMKEKEEQPTPTTMPAEDFIVHAVWTANTYTIKFDKGTNDPEAKIEGEMDDQIVTYGTKNDRLNKNEFTREGYDFIGWTREQPIYENPSENFDYSDEQSIESNIENYLVSAENGCITLYPVWKAKEYTVTYHVNGGTATEYTLQYIVIEDDCITAEATYNDSLFLYTSSDLKKDGYVFGGWYVDLDGDYPVNGSDDDKDAWYEDHENDEDYFLGPVEEGGWRDVKYIYPRNIDLYLRWKPAEYNFIFELFCQVTDATLDSEDVVDEWTYQRLTITEKYNKKIELPKFKIHTEYGDETPRPGYDFVGWFIWYQDPVTKENKKKYITEDDILNAEFYETYLEGNCWYDEYYIDAEWKERKDVKYKINIYQQEIDLNHHGWEIIDPIFPDEPTVTYEMTGTPWKQIDITSMLSHKKYQYKGFNLRDDGNNYEKIYNGRYNPEHDFYGEMYGNSIAPDGSTEFNVYYLRNIHQIYAFRKRSDMVKNEWGSWQNAIWSEYPFQYDQEITDSDWNYLINFVNDGLDSEKKFDSFVVMSPISIQDLPTKMPDDDLLVVATYEGDKFDITFDANGGEFKDGFKTRKITQYYDTLFRVPQDVPYRENYAFDGWYLEDGTKIERAEDCFVSFRGERTAYAHWAKPMVEVTTVDPEDEESSSTVIYSNLVNAAKDINEEYSRNVTIKLLIDTTVHDSVTLSCENITFDLNGHTLFFESNYGESFITFDDSNVTITDTTIDELGKLVSTGSSTVVVNNTIFTMDAGTLENQGTDPNGCVLYINNDYPEYTINILGGSIIYSNNTEEYIIENPTCIYNDKSSYINIGSDSSKDSSIVLSIPDTSNGYIINNLKNVTINGGAFVAPNGTLGKLVIDETSTDDDDDDDGGEGEEGEEERKKEKPKAASDETVINSGYFELKNPLDVTYIGDAEVYKKEIFTGGFFNIENIDLIDNYIPEGKVIINSFGGYFGNNSYLYFYEIGDRESTIVHFVVTNPITHEQVGEAVTKDDVFTGDKISSLTGIPKPSDTTDYYFEGWTTSPDGNNNVTIISNPFEHTLYSLWAKATRDLVFTIADKSKDIVDPENLDPAEEVIPSSTINIRGVYPELPAEDYINSIGRKQNPKYKFGGWYTSTNKRVNQGDSFVINGIIDESDIVLRAKWIEADVYLIKMNSVLEGSDTVKSIANLMCSNNVVYENTDGNEIKAINEDKEKYNFLYWKINDYVAKYDQTKYKWNIIENYGESNETIIDTIDVGEEGNDEVLNSKYIALNFDLFARPGSKDININAVYEYIGAHNSLLTVEGHKPFKVEVECEKPSLFGLLSETEKTTYEAALDLNTQLYTVEALIELGSMVKLIYEGEDFSSWVKSSNIILSKNPELEFTIAVDTNIKLVTKSDNGELGDFEYYVEFRNNSGLLINSAIVTNETFGSVIESTAIPSLTGWTFRYWSLDYEHEVNFESIVKAAGENKNTVTLRPIYKIAEDVQKTTVYIYTVINEQESEHSVLYDQQVGSSRYISAPKIEGKTFSYWAKKDGTILGYTNAYAITLIDNSEYKYYAHYDEKGFDVKPIITLNGIVKVTDITGEMESQKESHKIVYSVARSVPSDYEMLEQGIIYSTSTIFATMDSKQLDYNFRFDIADATGWTLKPNLKAYIGSHEDAVNVLTVRFDRTGKEDTTIYLRGYVIYKSKVAGSKPIIIYTNVAAEKFNEYEGDE